MTHEEILRELAALPPEGQRQVVDFIAFLRTRYAPSQSPEPPSDLAQEAFIGMWRDREDMREWVKR